MWGSLKKTAKFNPYKVTYLANVKASDLARQAIILMDQADLIDQHPHNFAETLSEKDTALFCEVVWEWATQGVLRLSAAQSNGWEAFYVITRYGVEALKGDSYEPTLHDPEGYVQALTERVVELAPVALQTFRHGAMRVTMVMLGGASERLLLLLCESLYPGIKTERSISQV